MRLIPGLFLCAALFAVPTFAERSDDPFFVWQLAAVESIEGELQLCRGLVDAEFVQEVKALRKAYAVHPAGAPFRERIASSDRRVEIWRKGSATVWGSDGGAALAQECNRHEKFWRSELEVARAFLVPEAGAATKESRWSPDVQLAIDLTESMMSMLRICNINVTKEIVVRTMMDRVNLFAYAWPGSAATQQAQSDYRIHDKYMRLKRSAPPESSLDEIRLCERIQAEAEKTAETVRVFLASKN